MEAVIPMNGFMELAEEDLMVVDGGGPMLAAYPVDWKGLYNEVVGGFLGGAAGAIATGNIEKALVSGIGGAVAGGVKYYVKNPWPTYFFMIY
ncbi:Blp family class II bacteriocin [Thermoanaerobacter sp. A7A]|jgi:hypothetical protein|uniref:Blp family class II bacteriocin n=1 Tax=Thermoanaerobacter sp. A7A TaxID=1350366 RepID=UPI00041C8646|nr:Blp family class II bacteriocin [Thermoanaerobacter sp. A7A]